MIKPLSRHELAARPDYVRFIQGLAVGDGGMASTVEEGVQKTSLKNRLRLAADAAGVQVKFHRTDETTVVFEVVGRR
ncbi:MAG: hypothetical protein U0470_04350 [Anaerolineae bacterium]